MTMKSGQEDACDISSNLQQAATAQEPRLNGKSRKTEGLGLNTQTLT